MPPNKLLNQEEILSRELGLIQFYRRVLAQSIDEKIPILERLNYLCIVSRNCDEFFEIRVARLLKWNKDHPDKLLPEKITVANALALVRNAISTLYDDIYRIYNHVLIPQLRQQAHVIIVSPEELLPKQLQWSQQYFIHELKPLLTPISIDQAHPFPLVLNKKLHFAVDLSGKDQYGRHPKIAIVEAPRILPRVIKLPATLSDGQDVFILLRDLIKLHVGEFFNGLTIQGCYPFRVTRNSELSLKNNTTNLRLAVVREIQNRKYAECSRLELDVSSGTPNQTFINILLNQFNIGEQDLYLANGPVNLSRLEDIVHMVNRPELKFQTYNPGLPNELVKEADIFKAMSKSDILLHTPYQSFDPVVELTKRAAYDPQVVAVKMTVYRTGADSELAQNLIRAAQAGKQVVASVELFARFEEETNAELANSLEAAGAHVVYGVMGYKVHAKMLLIVRKEDNSLKQYVHLGSGNYHQLTARTYTDFGLLTTNPIIANDVDNIFAQITGVGRAGIVQHLYQSPFTLHDMLLKSIEQETTNAINSQPGMIMAKMNSLTEDKIIHALYRASQAGVKINLIVRGACSLRPGILGVSHNIQVISIVGRFLEHHRVFYFYNGGKEDVYLSSADWMHRNFFRRVETCVPILEPKIKRRIIAEGLKIYLRDNAQAWLMDSNGNYSQVKSRGKKFSAQQSLIAKLGNKK